MTKIKENIFYILIIIFPLLDILTSLSTRYFNFSLSPGLIIRGLILACCLVYTITKSKSRKINIFFYILLFAYFILYLLFKKSYLNIPGYIYEFSSFCKYWFFPIILIFFLNYISSSHFNKDKFLKALNINLIITSLGIIIPKLTNTAFASYSTSNEGIIGWFYSANETGTIIVMLFSLLFIFFFEKNYLKRLITAILAIVSISLIGTKVVTFSLIIITTLALINNLIKTKFNLKNKDLLYTIGVFIISICVVFNSNTIDTVFSKIGININTIKTTTSDKKPNPKPVTTHKKEKTFIEKLLSGRNIYLKNTYKIYRNSNLQTKLFGIGFVDINNNQIKLIELDFFDILLNYGIIGAIIYFIPLLVAFFLILKNILQEKIITYDIIMLSLFIGLTLAISFSAGHVLGAPAVSFYLAFLIALLYSQTNKKGSEN